MPAALLTLLLALPMVLAEAVARTGKKGRAAILRGALILPIAVSPMALGLGCFLILRLALDGTPRAILGIVLLNAIMVVPFAAAILRPAVERARARHDHLCRALGIAGWSRWRLIDWPILRPSIGTALAMAAAMALGDLIGIGLFGDAKIRNLTLLLYDQLGAYRMGGAAVTAALLMLLIFVLYQVDRAGSGWPCRTLMSKDLAVPLRGHGDAVRPRRSSAARSCRSSVRPARARARCCR